MEQHPRIFYEIEMKALLTKEKHAELLERLPKILKQFNDEVIYTTRYRPGDVRLRHSAKTLEIVSKEGDPTVISRREIVIPVESKGHLDHFSQVLESVGCASDPPWTKHKQEFTILHKGFEYVVCLQDIKNFAYIIEVEHLSETDDRDVHEPNIREIFAILGVEPIDPKNFTERINKYIKENKNIK